MSKNKPLKPYAFRMNEVQMKRAAELQIDVAALMRKALTSEILQRSGICPYCGQKEKAKK